MNLALDEDELAFRRKVQEFLHDNLTEDLRRGQLLTSGVYPPPEISLPWHRKLAAHGWVAPLWPTEYGGPGWTPIQRFIFESESALACAPLINPMGVRLIGPVLIRFGTADQKARFLPRILSGDDYWCQGYSEPNAGSDLTSLRTAAVLDGDEYIVTGSKIWTTHAHYADMMFMLARTSDEGRPREGISFLLIDMKSRGISIRPIISMSGEHELNQVFFDEVRVPQANLVGKENGGWACARYLLEFERGAGLFSARLRSSLNRLRLVLDDLAAHGIDMLAEPGNAARFADIAIELDAFEMLELRTLGAFRVGDQLGVMSSMLKLRSSRIKQSIGLLGVTLLRSYAMRWPPSEGDDIERGPSLISTLVPDYLNGRAQTIFGGATEVQLGLIAKSIGL